MKSSFLLSIALSGWFVLFYSHRGLFLSKLSSLSINSIFNLPNQNYQHNVQNIRIKIQSPIKQHLYNSISEGMSYDEVRSIIGWDGVLIYKNDIHDGNTHINEQIYQWNNQDIYSTNYRYQNVGEMNPYWSVTLQFQNHKLVGKTDYNLQP